MSEQSQNVEGAGAAASSRSEPIAPSRKRVSRRVTRPAPPGVDPTPQSVGDVVKAAEDADHSWGEAATGNDADLKLNKPPHWG